jgi:hypothetical protein
MNFYQPEGFFGSEEDRLALNGLSTSGIRLDGEHYCYWELSSNRPGTGPGYACKGPWTGVEALRERGGTKRNAGTHKGWSRGDEVCLETTTSGGGSSTADWR